LGPAVIGDGGQALLELSCNHVANGVLSATARELSQPGPSLLCITDRIGRVGLA